MHSMWCWAEARPSAKPRPKPWADGWPEKGCNFEYVLVVAMMIVVASGLGTGPATTTSLWSRLGGKRPTLSSDRVRLINAMPVRKSYCDQRFSAATVSRGPSRHHASSINSVHSLPPCCPFPTRNSLAITSCCQFLQGSSHGWRTQAHPLRRQHRLCQRCCLLDLPLLAQCPCSPECQHGLQVVAWPSCTC